MSASPKHRPVSGNSHQLLSSILQKMTAKRILICVFALSFLMASAMMALSADAMKPRHTGATSSGGFAETRENSFAMGRPAMMDMAEGMAAPEPMMATDSMRKAAPMYAKSMNSAVGGAVHSMMQAEPPRAPDEKTVILKTGSMDFEAPSGTRASEPATSVRSLVERVEAEVVSKHGAYVESSRTWSDEWIANAIKQNTGRDHAGPTGASMTVRVPAESFDAVRADLRKLASSAGAKVSSESSSAQDVSEQYRDTQIRLANDEVALKQMKSLLEAANNVNEVLSIKREMDSITQRIEAAKGSLQYYDRKSAMSTLNLSFNTAYPPAPPPDAPNGWSVGKTFGNALGSLGKLGVVLVDVFIYALVFSLPLSALAFAATIAAKYAMARYGGRSSAAGSSSVPLMQARD